MVPVYFDMEFTGLHQYTKPISIGLISQLGDTFYGEFSSFYHGFADIKDEHFYDNSIEPHLTLQKHQHNWLSKTGNDCTMYGNANHMAEAISDWLLTVGKGDKVQMWSDCYAYDWVLFCELWGHALNIPKHIHYIPMDLSTLLHIRGIDPDINREEYVGQKRTHKHNALHDAEIIMLCVEKAIRSL